MATQDSQPFRWHYTELDDHEFQIRGHTLFFVIVLFAVVILVTLLFLYARWVCRYQQQHFPSSTAYTSHALRTPPAQHRKGLDPSTIKALPITMHQSSSFGTGSNCNSPVQSECCICLGVFEDGDKVKVLPGCHHGFHCDCLDKWLASQSSCPLCRASLQVVVDSVVV